MNQAAYTKLVALGYTGPLNQMLNAFYLANGATTNNLGMSEMEFLASKGFSTGPVNERWYKYLTSLSYPGSLNDKLVQYWINYSGGGGGAPILSSATGTQTGATTASLSVSTDTGNGTLYAIVSTSSTPPSVAQIQAGQQAGGTAAAWAGNQAVASTGVKNFSATGLTASTTYYAYFQHKNAGAQDSAVVASASFTTAAGGSANTLLLLNMNGPNGGTVFTDSSSYGRTVTPVGSVTTSSTSFKFGNASATFPGSSRLDVTHSTDFDFGTGDFTIQFWVRPISLSTGVFPTLVQKRSGGAFNGFVIFIDDDGSNFFYRAVATSNNTSWDVFNIPGGTATPGAWSHILLCRSGTITRFFVDGVFAGSSSNAGSITTNTQPIQIGGLPYIGNNAFIDDLRITKIAEKTTNSSFTPPTAELGVI